jgi:hypothetical protein
MEEGEVHFLYLDDEEHEQGPFPVSSVVSWVQSGFFSGSRRVKKVGGEGEFIPLMSVPELAQFITLSSVKSASVGEEGLVPQTEEEEYLSEYYKNYYAQAFAKAAEDYQKQVEEYNRQQELLKQQEENKKRGLAPDDGYVVPKPEFEDYRAKGKFAKIHGRFMADGQGGSELRKETKKKKQILILLFCFVDIGLRKVFREIARVVSWTATMMWRRLTTPWRVEEWKRTIPTNERRPKNKKVLYRNGWQKTRWRERFSELCCDEGDVLKMKRNLIFAKLSQIQQNVHIDVLNKQTATAERRFTSCCFERFRNFSYHI